MPSKMPVERIAPGNPGNVKLAPKGAIVAHGTPPEYTPPPPVRPLGTAGQQWWDWAWRTGASWLHPTVDSHYVQLVAEMIDERWSLRRRVMENDNFSTWRERAGLRQLEKQLISAISHLGFTPVDRSRMLVNPSTPDALDDLMAKRQAKAQAASGQTGTD